MTREGALRRRIFLALLFFVGCGPSADQRQEEARLGSRDHDYTKISKAQLILMYSGFGPVHIDGLMGPETREAIRDFQKSRRLRATGYIGDATWEQITELERHDGPFTVERVQRGLRNAGFDPGLIDGQAGWLTRDALSRYQQAKGLNVTGRLNPETWTALKSSMPLR